MWNWFGRDVGQCYLWSDIFATILLGGGSKINANQLSEFLDVTSKL